MNLRLNQLFGAAAPWLLRPSYSLLACLLGWTLTLPFTWDHSLLSLLGFVSVWFLLLTIWIEKPLISVLPLPPLTVFGIGICLRCGLGPILMALSGTGGDQHLSIWRDYSPPAVLLWLSFAFLVLLGALFQRHNIREMAYRYPEDSILQVARRSNYLKSKFVLLAWFFSSYFTLYVLLSSLSGAYNYQFDHYVRWTNLLWRLDTPVAAFSRLRDFWFILLPLWWFLLGYRWRIFLSLQLVCFVCMSFLSGSRGLILYPAILVLFGLWLTNIRPTYLRTFFILISVFVFTVSPLVYVVRDSPLFQNSTGITSRANSVLEVLKNPEPLFQKARWLGRDLYACHDPYLFTPRNINSPRAGFTGLSAIPFIWIPKHISPNRPIIFDGHLIAKQLEGVKRSKWSEVWFPCISLPADLMRRWSLTGVLAGSLLGSFFLYILFRLWYKTSTLYAGTFHLLIMFYPCTYIQSFPFGSLSETLWMFLWELPKYILLFYVVGLVLDHRLQDPKL